MVLAFGPGTGQPTLAFLKARFTTQIVQQPDR
jgi:hypothetical protein